MGIQGKENKMFGITLLAKGLEILQVHPELSIKVLESTNPIIMDVPGLDYATLQTMT